MVTQQRNAATMCSVDATPRSALLRKVAVVVVVVVVIVVVVLLLLLQEQACHRPCLLVVTCPFMDLIARVRRFIGLLLVVTLVQ